MSASTAFGQLQRPVCACRHGQSPRHDRLLGLEREPWLVTDRLANWGDPGAIFLREVVLFIGEHQWEGPLAMGELRARLDGAAARPG
jgi:hypothetical protein